MKQFADLDQVLTPSQDCFNASAVGVWKRRTKDDGGQKGKVRPEKVLASGRPEFIYRATEHRRNTGPHFRRPIAVRTGFVHVE